MMPSRGVYLWTLILGVLATGAAGNLGYKLSGPKNYTVFTGDIHVDYLYPTNVTLEHGLVLIVSIDKNIVVAETRIPSYNEATLTFSCGVIDHAGRFLFRMVKERDGQVLVESEPIYAIWSRFQLTLPSTHEALTNEVVLIFSSLNAQCESAHSTVTYSLEVVYYGKNDSDGGFNQAKSVVHTLGLRSFYRLRSAQFKFACKLFDQAGIYKVQFSTSASPAKPIATSNNLLVTWSEAYTLRIHAESIFPCSGYLSISYTHPPCSGDDDKIRLYRQVQLVESSAASPYVMVYQAEKRVQRGGTTVVFECSQFEDEVPVYCFKYASIAQNLAVTEQAIKCVPTHAGSELVIHGGWSDWAPWSPHACPAVPCGFAEQHRHRTCDNPAPSMAGEYCQGESRQSRPCRVICRETTTGAPLNPFTPEKGCACGCTMTNSHGKVIGTTGCRGSSLWIIRTQPGMVIRLRFEVFTLDVANHYTWIRVRNGDNNMAELLVNQNGGPSPREVVSSQNTMMVELNSPYHIMGGTEGFVASYWAVVDNATLANGHGGKDPKFWAHPVTFVGVALCAVIIVTAVIFVCRHRHIQKQKHKKQVHANQSLLVNGEVPNSPSHSGNSQQGSANISFADVPQSPTRRDYVMAKGVGVSTSPTREIPLSGSKKYRTKSPPGGRELSRGDGHHSRHSSQSSVSQPKGVGSPTSPCGSPYAANAANSDYLHDPSLFRVSPIPEGADKTKHDHHHRSGRHRQHSKSPPHSPRRKTSPCSPSQQRRDHSHRSRSPGSQQSQGSRGEPRNQSFKKAISNKNKDDAPLADCEDLSPTSPTSHKSLSPSRSIDMTNRKLPPTPGGAPFQPGYQSPDMDPRKKQFAGSTQSRLMNPITENIPMDSYRDRRNRRKPYPGEEDRNYGPASPGAILPDQRPPVEGGRSDSLTRRKGGSYAPTTPDIQNANVVPMSPTYNGRPQIKPLPLRGVQRPDGQSPENKPEDPNANTPSSMVSQEMSPLYQKTKLFPDSSQTCTPTSSMNLEQEWEYDDYMPNLPGSYFTMDPTAYTLTWSQQPPWAPRKTVNASRTNSELSVDPLSESKA